MARRTRGRLYTRGKSKRWYLQFYTNGQETVTRLLNDAGQPCQDQKEAEAARDRILAPLAAKDHAQRLRNVAHALTDAETRAVELARDRHALSDTWQAFLDAPNRPRPAESTLEQYRYQFCAFAAWMQAEHSAAARLDMVTPAIAGAYSGHLRRTLGTGTANKHLTLLRKIFEVLEPDRPNPFHVRHVGKGGNGKQQHREALSLAEVAALCDAADGEYRTLLFLGLYTAQRLADLCLLDWSAVNLRTGWIAFTQRKTGAVIDVPICGNLRPLLEATPARERRGYVLPELAARYQSNGTYVTRDLAAIFRAAEIPMYAPGTGPGTGKRAVLRKSFHSIRHTANTILLEAGIPPATVQAITGHQTAAMQAMYTHVSRGALTAAMQALPPVGGTLSEGATARRRLHEAIDELPDAEALELLAEMERGNKE